MPRAKALKVKVEDHPGVLGDIASALGAKGINVHAVHAYTEGGRGVVCLVVDKLAAANKVLAGRGLKPDEEELLEVQLANKPGTLGDTARYTVVFRPRSAPTKTYRMLTPASPRSLAVSPRVPGLLAS